jgi:hypothetical protein
MEASIISLQRQCFHKDEALRAVNMLSPGETYIHSKTAESSSRSSRSYGGSARGDGNQKSNANDTRSTPAADAAKERDRPRERGITTAGGGDRDLPQGVPFGVQSSPSMPPPTIDAPSTAPRPRNAPPEKMVESPEMHVDQVALDMIEDEEIWRQHDMQELAHAFGLHLEEESYPHNPEISHKTSSSGESSANGTRSSNGSSTLHPRTQTHPHSLRHVSPDILRGARPHQVAPPSGGEIAPRQSGGGGSGGGRRGGDERNIDSRNPPIDVLKLSHGKDYNVNSKRTSESPNDATRNDLPQRRISYASLC